MSLEDENFDPLTRGRRQLYCFAISAKRYALFNMEVDGRPLIRKASEHGLGHFLNPTDPESSDGDWMRQLWELIVCEALDLPVHQPPWLDRPAVSRLTASSPAMLTPLLRNGDETSFAEQPKPFNFLVTAQVRSFGHPIGVDPKRFHLVAPYSPNPDEWLAHPWTDCHSGKSYNGTVTGEPTKRHARLKSYRDVLLEYRLHPEAKSVGLDGRSRRGTRGLLARRPATAAVALYIGKESNRLEEVQAGLVHDVSDVLTEYTNPAEDEWSELILPALRSMPVGQISAASGLHRRSVERIRAGTRPRAATRERLARLAVSHARSVLLAANAAVSHDSRSCLAAFREKAEAQLRCGSSTQ